MLYVQDTDRGADWGKGWGGGEGIGGGVKGGGRNVSSELPQYKLNIMPANYFKLFVISILLELVINSGFFSVLNLGFCRVQFQDTISGYRLYQRLIKYWRRNFCQNDNDNNDSNYYKKCGNKNNNFI